MQRIALEDRLAIEDLVHRNAAASDGRDFAGLQACFRDDATMTLHGPDGAVQESVRGAAAIAAWVEARHRAEFARGDRRRHLTTNFRLVSGADDAAVARSYLCVLSTAAGGEPRITAMGHYEDHVRRDDGGWRFHRRLVFIEGRSDGTPRA